MSHIQVILNPEVQKLTLAYASQKPETVSILIKDSIGQALYCEEVRMEDGFNVMEILELKHFLPGLYTLELQKADRLFYTHRLIKN